MCNLLSTASFGIALKFGLNTYTFSKTADFLIRELGLVECWPDTITCSGLQGQHCTFKARMKMTSRLFVKLSWKLEVGADSMWERWGCGWEEKPLIWTPLHLKNCPPFRTRINYWEDQKGWIYYFNTHQIIKSGPPSQQESDWRGLWFLIHVIWILNPEWSGQCGYGQCIIIAIAFMTRIAIRGCSGRTRSWECEAPQCGKSPLLLAHCSMLPKKSFRNHSYGLRKSIKAFK